MQKPTIKTVHANNCDHREIALWCPPNKQIFFHRNVVIVFRSSIVFLLLGILFVAAFFAPIPLSVHAQTTTGSPSFSLLPVVDSNASPEARSHFVLDAQPGSTLQETVRVTNIGTAVGSINIYPVSATTSQNGGVAFLAKGDSRRDVAAWMIMPTQSLTLVPKQSQDIPFQVVVPSSVQAGQHFGGIAAESLTPGSSKNGQFSMNMITRTIMPIRVTLPGPLVEQMTTAGAKAGGSNGYQTIIVTLANTGNVMVNPTGELKVSNSQGQTLQDLPLNLDTFLPETSINYPVAVQNKALTAGNYPLSLLLHYGHGKILSYTTTLTITSQQVQQAFQSNTGPLLAPSSGGSLSSMPLWQIILVALAAVIILLMGGKKLYDLIVARSRKQKSDFTLETDDSGQPKNPSKKRDKVS